MQVHRNITEESISPRFLGEPHMLSSIAAKMFPRPRDFTKDQRFTYGLLASGGGMFCGAASGFTIALLMWGGWNQAEEHTIVTILGWSLAGFIGAMIVVIIG